MELCSKKAREDREGLTRRQSTAIGLAVSHPRLPLIAQSERDPCEADRWCERMEKNKSSGQGLRGDGAESQPQAG